MVAEPEQTPGQRLAQARRLLAFALGRDLSQADAAALAGVSANAWNEWERGLSYPRAGNLEKLLELFVRQGMPYITGQWIDYGIEHERFPHVVTDAIEVVPSTVGRPEDVRARGKRPPAKKTPTRRRGAAGE